MILFEATKWAHILSSTLLFGTGIGTAFHMWMSHKRGSVGEIALAARNTVLADWLFTLPAGIIQPLTGIALIVLSGWNPWSSWLIVAYCLYAIALTAWVIVVVMQMRVAQLASIAHDTGTELPVAYHHAMRHWFWLGWPGFFSLVVIFYLMVAKPELW